MANKEGEDDEDGMLRWPIKKGEEEEGAWNDGQYWASATDEKFCAVRLVADEALSFTSIDVVIYYY